MSLADKSIEQVYVKVCQLTELKQQQELETYPGDVVAQLVARVGLEIQWIP